MYRAMGNTDSAVVQKRLAHFRPDERSVIEGIFDRLHGSGADASGKTGTILSLDMLKVSSHINILQNICCESLLFQ